MMIPSLHLNGTSAQSLLEALRKADSALREAIAALASASPNARDYYPQGPDAFRKADDEHDARIAAVEKVRSEICEIYQAVDDANDARARRDEGYRERCYFCDGTWGHCTCAFPNDPDAPGFDDAPGFEWGGVWITSPNRSSCSRFFVDPTVYYGEAYASSSFAGKGPPAR